ncbi:hypothetical protein JRO89_XS04G0021200 [Xanthoceras sorbifolium]|uniref:Zinc finger PMZ-type domain-containing protein n=1 Tax=Xanthoceras sorbifolium TaxID=99658 RepID=A0ABQ8I434_9ROSI|nr:hypothetical protein JRO89_XS04G0021200 [Xanthoceras sorbifolium]
MEKLRAVSPNAYKYMMDIPQKYWCMHAFNKHVKSGHTTNVIEAFNSWVNKYRNLPALLLLENIRCKIMKRINTKFSAAQKWTSNLTPMVNSKIAERLEEARFVDVLCAGEHEFEVMNEQKFFVMNLKTQSCDRGRWEVTGIPYKHAFECGRLCGQVIN